MSVDMFAEEVDLSTLDAGAAAEVQSFATDVSSSFAASVSSSLGVNADTVAVTCLYRNSDVTKLDLLTLEGFCGSSRKLNALFLRERRLQAQGFGVEIEVLGDDAVQTATESDGEDNGQSATEMLAAQIASTAVVIESNLLPEGVTVGADLGDISVEVATQAPTPVPTPDPTATPTLSPTATPTPDPTATPTPSPTVLAPGAGGVGSNGSPPPPKTTPRPRSSSTSAMNAGGSFVFDSPSSTTAMIAGGVLVASFLVIVPGANALRIHLNKTKQEAEANSKLLNHGNVSMEEINPEEIRIEIPELHDETAKSDHGDHDFRKQFTEADL
jgi:hypothetical protein